MRISDLSLALVGVWLATAAEAQPVVESVSTTGSLSGSSTTIVVNAPAGAGPNDLLVGCVTGTLTGDTTDVTASGWSHVATRGGSGNSKVGMLWKVWDSSDGASYTFSLGTVAGSVRRGGILRISNANLTAPGDATPSETGGSGGTGAQRNYTTITTATANSLAIGCMVWATNDSVYTPDVTVTNRFIQARQAMDTKELPTPSATGTLTGTGTSTVWDAIFWAVAEAEAPPGPSGSVRRCLLLGVCE